MPAFIETQFPIARLSAESYKERKANNGQTLTRLGKWWGRKPLILVRASILGMLMPASDNPKKDREIFLKILTMDDDGVWQRCKPAIQRKLARTTFDALPYAERIKHCERPKNVTGPTTTAWAEVNAHLYCVEVKPEGCDYFIPLAPSWLIGEKSKVVARWHRVVGSDRLQPEIVTVTDDELKLFKEKKGATVDDSRVVDPFDPTHTPSVEALRGPEGLRRWTNEDVMPQPGDVFQERLYCIRWVKTVEEINAVGQTVTKTVRHYAAPDEADLAREAKVLELLRERFSDWQRKGFIPSKALPEGGAKTEEPIRTRGWTHWHHLFTPRQLLTHGLIAEISSHLAKSNEAQVGCLLGLGRMANWDSRLCRWRPDPAGEGVLDVFSNQALNTFLNYGNRGTTKLETAWLLNFVSEVDASDNGVVADLDARDLRENCDLWVTDPPYADAINYHELGDFFIAWYDKQLVKAFPDWTPDARAELAVRGDGEDFRRSMVEIYRNLARHMPDNGLQMVMFTHQDPAVWADLGMILWAAGLKATAAWTISTETEAAGIKKGNYVQGTVCLVLRKRAANEPGFLDEVYPLVEDEVKRQIASMQALDEDGEPNFNDADYQLAAYAAALKVLTQYGTLDGRDVEHEVFAVRARNEKSDFQTVIERALGIACDTLVPRGLENSWRDLSLVERYYLRALDIESRGERRKGMYEELARGFGVNRHPAPPEERQGQRYPHAHPIRPGEKPDGKYGGKYKGKYEL